MDVLVTLIFGAGAGLSFGVATFLIFFRCRHAWELVDKTEMPPPIKSAVDGMMYWPSDIPKLLGMTVVLALRCPKCGAAKIHKVTQIP